MTIKEAKREFIEMAGGFDKIALIKKNDSVMLREYWNIYTDHLCKDGRITVLQYNRWGNPFLEPGAVSRRK